MTCAYPRRLLANTSAELDYLCRMAQDRIACDKEVVSDSFALASRRMKSNRINHLMTQRLESFKALLASWDMLSSMPARVLARQSLYLSMSAMFAMYVFFLEATALSPSFLLRLMKVVEEPSKFDLLN